MDPVLLTTRSRLSRWPRWVRCWLACGTSVILLIFGRPIWHLWQTHLHDTADREVIPDGFIDDASAMNVTAVIELWSIPEDTAQGEQQLRELLARARREHLRVSIAGARHSMGGHTIAPDGIVIETRHFRNMSIDLDGSILHVQAGAIWNDVLEYLEPHGLSVGVMQSNDSFSVGGSISVNCHGWQFGQPPIAATVESFRIMLSDGKIVQCNREDNAELFGLVLGGYGLFGVILDVDLRVVRNRRYRVERYVVAADNVLETFDREVVRKPDVEMVYARLDVSTENFLNEVLIYTLVHDPAENGEMAGLQEKGMANIRRQIFRGSVNSEYGKRLRWDAETNLQPMITPRHVSRNQVLSEGVEVFANRSSTSTDILHEYFVPRNALVLFLQDLKRILPEHKCDLLNVTIREVETDNDTYLRYADQQLFSLVMMFDQARTIEADAAMEALTQELIDAVLNRNGRYYLPYRLHATQTQFEAAYPQAREFFALKRKYDPEELFVNQFYLKYGRPSDVGTQKN